MSATIIAGLLELIDWNEKQPQNIDRKMNGSAEPVLLWTGRGQGQCCSLRMFNSGLRRGPFPYRSGNLGFDIKQPTCLHVGEVCSLSQLRGLSRRAGRLRARAGPAKRAKKRNSSPQLENLTYFLPLEHVRSLLTPKHSKRQ